VEVIAMTTRRRSSVLAGALVSVLLATACSSDGGNGSTRGVDESTTTGTSSQRTSSPRNSTATVVNEYHPLEPGYQSIREGHLNRGHTKLEHRRVYTVTNVTKVIDGMRATLVLDQDVDAGEISEQAIDYLALDPQGNVIYLGSYTEAYEGGRFVNANDAWLAGIRGAKRGILIPTHPKDGDPAWTQSEVPPDGGTESEVASFADQVCVPFGCYSNVLVVLEGGAEHKYYAPGVGGIKTVQLSEEGSAETEELINLTHLSPQGLAEISRETLRLDEHARTTAPDVFGGSEHAEMGS
jgi:hypothetical protein